MSDKPSVTVFVGNITEHASDALIRQLLMVCTIYYDFVSLFNVIFVFKYTVFNMKSFRKHDEDTNFLLILMLEMWYCCELEASSRCRWEIARYVVFALFLFILSCFIALPKYKFCNLQMIS